METDDEEDDGVSDTWAENMKNNDIEEGEIRPESSLAVDQTSDKGGENSIDGDDKLEGQETSTQPMGANIDAQSKKMVETQKHVSSELIPNVPPAPHPLEIPNNPFGPLQQLVPSGCFGPFPKESPVQVKEKAHIDKFNSLTPSWDVGGSQHKKRKRNFSDPLSELNVQLFPDTHQTVNNQEQENFGELSPSINLNENPTQGGEADCTSSQSNELNQIAKIGVEIGFQIDAEDPILAQVVGDTGGMDMAP
ncbi:hypothetical protein L2E82_16899 [Cichorium intybus]|uniref:Uncharacterized protein n=1 Tax=Cichorium intybus TaxID=13427 RepID=A0ACB9F6A5_CICIN|nr:hypothetical protein L2E82_16899 [Cichorium intybus]